MKKSKIPLEPLESRDETSELNNNSEYRKYQCKMCKKKFSSIKKLKNHIKHKHGDQTPENDMKNSNNNSNEQSSYQCNVCGKKLSSIRKLQKHQLKVHGEKKPEHYVNNAEFLEAMKGYKKAVNKAKREKMWYVLLCMLPIHTLTFSERSDSTLHLQNQSTSGKNYRNKKHWRSFFSFKKKGCTNFHRIQKEKCTTTNMKMNICSFLHSRLSSYRLF